MTQKQQIYSFHMKREGGVDLLAMNDLYIEPKSLDEFHYVSNINGAHQDSK